MPEITLTKGKTALVSQRDLSRVSQHRWHFDGRYAATNLPGGKKLRLHRFILELDNSDIQVDHKNENKLDCRRSNLRTVTEAEHKRRHVGRLQEPEVRKRMWKTRKARYGNGFKHR